MLLVQLRQGGVMSQHFVNHLLGMSWAHALHDSMRALTALSVNLVLLRGQQQCLLLSGCHLLLCHPEEDLEMRTCSAMMLVRSMSMRPSCRCLLAASRTC
jgi:hypothetical protein